MKKTTILLLNTLIISGLSFAQQLTIDIGRVSSSFDYTNSMGESNLNLNSESNFSYSIGYRKDLSKRFHYHGSLLLNHYSTYGSDQHGINSFTWDVSYFALEVGMDAEFYKKKGFSFFARAAGGPQFMMRGRQNINNETYNLKGLEQFDKPKFFIRPGVGFNYCSDTAVGVSVKYSYGLGLPLGTTDGEKLKIKTGTVSIGLIWSLKNCSYCYHRNR